MQNFIKQTFNKIHLINYFILHHRFYILLLTCFFCLNVSAKKIEKDKVILQLKWKNQFQFAGYYAALEKGYYKDVGLDVEIKEIGKAESTIDAVLNGKAQYGIGGAELVIHYMNGEPIIVLTCILQNSPSSLLVKSSNNLNTLNDLIGKTIEIDKEQSGIEIIAMLLKAGIKSNQYKTLASSYSLNNILANRVDAIEIYTSNEPFFLDKFGIPYKLFTPREYGINFYSDCLFTTRNEVERHPERVKKFRQASLKGWNYALDHPEEIANLILTKYQSTKTYEHLLFEAEEMRKLINPEFIDIGHCNKERWLNIVEVLSQQGLIKNHRNIDDFVYNPDYNYNVYTIRILLVILSVLTVITFYLIYYTLKLRSDKNTLTSQSEDANKKTDNLIEEIRRLNSEIKKLNSKSQVS